MPAKKKRGLASALAVLVLVFVLCFILNPGSENFKAFLSSRASSETRSTLGKNPVSDFASGLAGGLGSIAANAYARRDFLFFSLYEFKAGGKTESSYLGFLTTFMKLK
jgi:hypothetical protein